MSEENTNKLGVYGLVAAAVIIGIGAIYWVASGDKTTPEPIQVKVDSQPEMTKPELKAPIVTQPAKPVEQPQIIPETLSKPEKPPKPALPPLSDSDELIKQDIEMVYHQPKVNNLLVEQDLIRKFVVFVDNAAEGALMQQHSPVNKPETSLKVIPVDNNEYLIDPVSYKRYEPYVDMLSMVNSDTMVDYYKKFKPLITEAYEEIGYQDKKFEESLIEAIDLILATPLVEDDVKLIAPSAMYKFADEELESLKPIQKLLIRMGPENQLKVQAALEKIRKSLVE